jgi:hypothetical protein
MSEINIDQIIGTNQQLTTPEKYKTLVLATEYILGEQGYHLGTQIVNMMVRTFYPVIREIRFASQLSLNSSHPMFFKDSSDNGGFIKEFENGNFDSITCPVFKIPSGLKIGPTQRCQWEFTDLLDKYLKKVNLQTSVIAFVSEKNSSADSGALLPLTDFCTLLKGQDWYEGGKIMKWPKEDIPCASARQYSILICYLNETRRVYFIGERPNLEYIRTHFPKVFLGNLFHWHKDREWLESQPTAVLVKKLDTIVQGDGFLELRDCFCRGKKLYSFGTQIDKRTYPINIAAAYNIRLHNALVKRYKEILPPSEVDVCANIICSLVNQKFIPAQEIQNFGEVRLITKFGTIDIIEFSSEFIVDMKLNSECASTFQILKDAKLKREYFESKVILNVPTQYLSKEYARRIGTKGYPTIDNNWKIRMARLGDEVRIDFCEIVCYWECSYVISIRHNGMNHRHLIAEDFFETWPTTLGIITSPAYVTFMSEATLKLLNDIQKPLSNDGDHWFTDLKPYTINDFERITVGPHSQVSIRKAGIEFRQYPGELINLFPWWRRA